MKILISFCISLLMTLTCFAQSGLQNFDYDIVGVDIAKEGYYLVEVSAMVDKKKEATIDIAKKCAIHGCLFKGFTLDRISQRAIISSPKDVEEHTDYLNKLISEQYNVYTSSLQPALVVKVGKRFRVKATIAVAKEILRKDLEKAGVVRKLGL